jgi:enoyl-CoA hydratase/carnithine racemase
MFDEITYEVDDPVATITLSRPDSLNAWTGTMDVEIREAIGRAVADPAVVGIVVTGAGRAFCAGADMKLLDRLSSADPASAAADAGSDIADASAEGAGADVPDDFAGRFGYLMTVPKPIIAAVNGAVAGMAFPFALSCDLRVLCPESLFVTAFAERGLIAEWGLGWLLPQLVGPSVALDLLFSSRRVGGEEAYRLGLGNHLVERDDLLTFSRGYVEQLASSCSPASLAVMKRQVYEHTQRGLGAAEAESQRLMAESFGRPDFQEGVRSFLDKRPPRFERLTT